MADSPAFTHLPVDALLGILRFLQPLDLVTVGFTSKRMLELASQDCVWGPHCCRWLETLPDAASLGGVGLAELKRVLGLTNNKLLYAVMHRLGSWPVGVWYVSMDGWSQPGGQILVVGQASLGTLSGCLLSPAAVPGPPINQDAIWELHEWFEISIGAAGIEGRAGRGALQPVVSLDWCLPGDRGSFLSIAMGGDELVVYQGFQGADLHTPSSSRLLRGDTEAAPAPEQNELHFSRLLMKPPAVQLAQLGGAQEMAGPQLAAASGEDAAAALLQRLEGVYTACYGPHGMEVLQLRMAGPTEAPPPGCPITGLRLQALKITGDQNVPALKYSFVVDAATCRLGRYAPLNDDPFPQLGMFARPVLSFYESATVVVHLEDRPVTARFRALGQINQVPGVWDPEFVAATLVLYEQRGIGNLAFTLIFEDEGIQVRHAMDFFPLSIPLPGF